MIISVYLFCFSFSPPNVLSVHHAYCTINFFPQLCQLCCQVLLQTNCMHKSQNMVNRLEYGVICHFGFYYQSAVKCLKSFSLVYIQMNHCDMSSAAQRILRKIHKKACGFAYCKIQPEVIGHSSVFGILYLTNQALVHTNSFAGLYIRVLYALEPRGTPRRKEGWGDPTYLHSILSLSTGCF